MYHLIYYCVSLCIICVMIRIRTSCIWLNKRWIYILLPYALHNVHFIIIFNKRIIQSQHIFNPTLAATTVLLILSELWLTAANLTVGLWPAMQVLFPNFFLPYLPRIDVRVMDSTVDFMARILVTLPYCKAITFTPTPKGYVESLNVFILKLIN